MLRQSLLATVDPASYVYACARHTFARWAFGSDAKRRVLQAFYFLQAARPRTSSRFPIQNVLARMSFGLTDTSTPVKVTRSESGDCVRKI